MGEFRKNKSSFGIYTYICWRKFGADFPEQEQNQQRTGVDFNLYKKIIIQNHFSSTYLKYYTYVIEYVIQYKLYNK